MAKIILLIEDNQDIRENTAELLTLLGYTVIEADNGKKGLLRLEQQRPDIIICDIVMPEMDGYGFFEVFKQKLQYQGTPFIFSTAQSQKTDLEKARNMGVQHYLIKPFDEKDLINCLQKATRELL